MAESGECDYEIYTDGSVTRGTERRGEGIVRERERERIYFQIFEQQSWMRK